MDRNRVEHAEFVVGGMHHHGRVDVGERALAQHQLLAAASLLRGGSDHGHPSLCLTGHRGQSQARTQSRGGDDVVAAGMADARQGVVLAHDSHQRTVTSAGPGLEGGVHAVGPALHGQAVPVQHFGEQVVGVVLLEAQFGPLVDAVRHIQQFGGQTVDLRADPSLGFSNLHDCEPRATVILGPEAEPARPGPQRPASEARVSAVTARAALRSPRATAGTHVGIQTANASASTRRLSVRARSRRTPSR